MNLHLERPLIPSGVFMAPCSTTIGSVHISPGASIWYGVVIRGDDSVVSIGENSNIQDRAVIGSKNAAHNLSPRDMPTKIGKNVSVGHGAIVQNATLEDACIIGMASLISAGSTVETQSIVAPGKLPVTSER